MLKNPSQLSHRGRLAHSMIQCALFEPRCQDMKLSEIEALLRPILGQEALDEARSVFTDKPRNN